MIKVLIKHSENVNMNLFETPPILGVVVNLFDENLLRALFFIQRENITAQYFILINTYHHIYKY